MAEERLDTLTPVTVAFIDICDSTALYVTRGDVKAFQLAKACLELMTAEVVAAAGRVLQRVGDGVLAVFDAPVDGVRAAMRIVDRLDEPTSTLAREGVRVHIGLSSGVAVLRASDVYGDVANVAARLLGRAGAGEIFLSSSVYEALPADLRDRLQLVDEMTLRNRPDPVVVYKVVAAGPHATVRMPTRRHASAPTMHVTYGEHRLMVGALRPRVTIGRDAGNDIRIDAEVVSRRHAEIAWRGDRFMLVDRSTNGTYVYADNGPMLRLIRDELALTGAGRIALGDDQPAHSIRYHITTP